MWNLCIKCIKCQILILRSGQPQLAGVYAISAIFGNLNF